MFDEATASESTAEPHRGSNQPAGWDLAVIGLGYVGLPLAQAAAAAGLRVVGLDLVPSLVDQLNAGRSHVDDLADQDIATMLGQGFTATTDETVLSRSSVAVICVPTPLDDDSRPDLGAVTGAGRTIARNLRPGTLVVLESTTWPGTTEEVLCPILEESGLVAGQDFHLAYSPERIDPGNPTYGFRNTPKVVGGLTPDCRDRAAGFYGRMVERVVAVNGLAEAEMAKLLENTYRHVNIALVNEMAMFCDELDIDLWEAIDAASTKPFGFQAFRPGPGVGGHCIPVDPNYLSHRVRRLGYPFRFVELAQEVNERMPAYVVARITRMLNNRSLAVNGSSVLLLGVTYKADIADERETPALPLARRLRTLGANLSYADPYVTEWTVAGAPVPRVMDLGQAIAEADITVLLQPHAAFDLAEIQNKAQLVLDTRGVLADSDTVERL
jgi:UDP-N-acetyl-D-glucosamine dehydrogenase